VAPRSWEAGDATDAQAAEPAPMDPELAHDAAAPAELAPLEAAAPPLPVAVDQAAAEPLDAADPGGWAEPATDRVEEDSGWDAPVDAEETPAGDVAQASPAPEPAEPVWPATLPIRDARSEAAEAPVAEPPVAAPAWPPVGDRGADPMPLVRTPAGAYLPPSAVLPPLDDPSGTAAQAGLSAGQAGGGSAAVAGSAPRSAAASLLGSFAMPGDAHRQVVAAGSGLAAVGYLLPWTAFALGSGPSGYFAQWGLAGPGQWIVLLSLLGLATVAVVPGPLARLPIGIPAIALASLLLGLVWPYVFGPAGGSIGTWAVLVGALLLAVGGMLGRRARHAPPEPLV
jgi:hypothetical protein